MAEGTVRCCLLVPVEIVADQARLCDLLTEALDRVAEETRAVGWRLQGDPAGVHPAASQHAAHLSLEVTLPEAAGEHLAVVVTVAATDELDAMLAS